MKHRYAIVIGLVLTVLIGYLVRVATRDDRPPTPDVNPGAWLTSPEQVERVRSHPPRATFEIEPSSGRVQVSHRIRCQVRLTVPEGTPAPLWAYLTLRYKGLDANHAPMEVKGREGDTYLLEKTILAPSTPEKGQLVLIAHYSIDSRSPLGKTRPIEHEILGPDIEVYP